MSEEEPILEEEDESSGLREQEEETENEPRAFPSSMIAEAGYNKENEEIEITFTNGRSESYSAEDQEWKELKDAPSPGRWMHEHLLGR